MNFSIPDVRDKFPNSGIFIRNLKSITAVLLERTRQYSIAHDNARRHQRKVDLSSRYLAKLYP